MQKKQWRAGTASQAVNRSRLRCYFFDYETLKCHSNTSRLFSAVPRSARRAVVLLDAFGTAEFPNRPRLVPINTNQLWVMLFGSTT